MTFFVVLSKFLRVNNIFSSVQKNQSLTFFAIDRLAHNNNNHKIKTDIL